MRSSKLRDSRHLLQLGGADIQVVRFILVLKHHFVCVVAARRLRRRVTLRQILIGDSTLEGHGEMVSFDEWLCKCNQLVYA